MATVKIFRRSQAGVSQGCYIDKQGRVQEGVACPCGWRARIMLEDRGTH